MKKPKKIIGIVLAMTMIVSVLMGIGTITAFAYDTGVAIEAESGILGNSMTSYYSPTAGGGHVISVTSGGMLTNPETLSAPDASYSFTISTAGTYKVYSRAYAPSNGNDSYWYRWDGGTYVNSAATVGVTWTWQETSGTTLSVGTHTLDICHRETGYYIDLIVVATNMTTDQKNAVDASISVGGSAAANFNTVSGSVMVEAENTTLNTSLYGTTADSNASNGNVITALVTQTSPIPSPDEVGAEFNISPDRTAKYDIWVRYSAISNGQDSMYYSFNGGTYVYKGLTITGTNPSDYKWIKIDSTTSPLYVGAKYNFKLYPREAGARIDKIVVTSYPFFNPSGEVTTLDDISSYYSLSSTAYPTPTITPPASHPRLEFTSSDITGIQANMAKSQDANALAAYNNYLAQNVDGVLGTVIVSSTNYNYNVLANIEAYALKYALDGDSTYGNKAVNAIKNYLNTIIFIDTDADVERPIGHTIFVSAEVYDWCYPLLTAADKNFIIAADESIAKRMEIGYPPSGESPITTHGSEFELLRDQLSFGIATYNERPDIYNYCAGRLLSQYLEPRNYWYASATHYQGDSYGQWRYNSEIYFQWIMKRMSGQTMFASEGEFVPYQWIYTRRPDGQTFRNGDNYQETGSAIGTYWKGDLNPAFFSANFYGNSYVKQEYASEDPNYNTFTLNNGILTPVSFLLFNNPDLAGQTYTSSFPLTKYFGSPNGMMVARTGWTEPNTVDLSSNVAMAQMLIGEQWSGNHQHLDAGSFQLYYKGALASESGVYDSYATSEDTNYNKETIAHNSLLIMDPNETPYYGTAVNSGGQRRQGGEAYTFSQWMSGGYDRGTVLDEGYDTTSAVPQYSYIKGDITRAYTAKVSQVLRSMLFMPLSDASHPAAFVVMDKVTATNPTFKKTWLLHSQEDITINGNMAITQRDTDGYNGRLDLTTLLPSGATLTKVGGSGHEFDINGINYAATTMGGSACEHGLYRLEASPSSSNATDYFLNVMQVSDASANATPLAASLIETDSVAGAKIDNRVAIFNKNKDRMTGTVTFTIPGSETSGLKIAVAGVAEGNWMVYDNSKLVCTAIATSAGGILYFNGGAGSYSLIQSNTIVYPASYASTQNAFSPYTVVADSSAPNGKYIYAPGYNSTSIAPTAGQASYDFYMPASGNATIYATILAPNNGADSFWYKIDSGNWTYWGPSADSSNWQTLSQNVTGLSSGMHTLTVAYREGNMKIDSIAINQYCSEAEAVSLQSNFSPFVVATDTTAGGGKYIYAPGYNSTLTPPSTGQASFAFSLASAGAIDVFATVLSQDTDSDSFWYKIDNGSWTTWNVPFTSSSWQTTTQSITGLASGAHTLTIAYCEGNTKIDKITISTK